MPENTETGPPSREPKIVLMSTGIPGDCHVDDDMRELPENSWTRKVTFPSFSPERHQPGQMSVALPNNAVQGGTAIFVLLIHPTPEAFRFVSMTAPGASNALDLWTVGVVSSAKEKHTRVVRTATVTATADLQSPGDRARSWFGFIVTDTLHVAYHDNRADQTRRGG